MRFMSDRNDWFAGAEERNNCSDKGSKDSNLQYNKSYGENIYKVSDEKENNLLKKAHYVLTLVKNAATIFVWSLSLSVLAFIKEFKILVTNVHQTANHILTYAFFYAL